MINHCRCCRFCLKSVCFAAVFYALCVAVSFFIRDDVDTYTSAMMRELHSPSNIDVLICGASHVSHGLYSAQIKETLALDVMNCGTPNQPMDGSAALLDETLRRHGEIKEVWVECDFAVADADVPWMEREPGKAFFLVQNYLQNTAVKLRYTLTAISPAYYLNALLPIGKEQLLTLNPKRVAQITRVKLKADYWEGKYIPVITDGVYVPGGLVMDMTEVKAGTLSSGIVSPIDVQHIGNTWQDAVRDIVSLCKERGVKLMFFSNPSTDYYLVEKGNYDEYLSFLRHYIGGLGCEYYDFSLLRPNVCRFASEDFFDDNHLNKRGIEKFTAVFCDFISGKIDKSAFYDTFAQKIEAQDKCIYGLVLDEAKNKKSIAIYPVMASALLSRGGADASSGGQWECQVIALTSAGDEVRLEAENVGIRSSMKHLPAGMRFRYPAGTNGRLVIDYYLDGKKQGTVTEHYTAL